jgi:hypothetical protein
MGTQYVAAATIEFEHKGRSVRVERGRTIPDTLDDDSRDELTRHGSIVTADKWAEIEAEEAWRAEPITTTRGRLLDAMKDPDELRELVVGEAVKPADERSSE